MKMKFKLLITKLSS